MRRLRQQRTLPPQCFQGDCLVILTIPVLLYQLLFVLALYIASRLGTAALNLTTILCLLWRSEERRVGKAWVSSIRSRGSPHHLKKNYTHQSKQQTQTQFT